MTEDEKKQILEVENLNCWEYQKCGQEKLGENDKNKCPVVKLADLDAGKVCWIIHATLCGGKLQGGAFSKFKSCRECGFYKLRNKNKEKK
jgi:hypothetical protein